jgi:alkylated DNA repair protein alkB family protein 7
LTAFPNPSTLSSSAQSNASGGFSDVLHYPSILKRLYALLPHSPTSDLARAMHESLVLPDQSARRADHPDEPFVAPLKTTTHALHLSPIGRIDKHVDNVEASGSTIIGLSLGSERILRLERDDVSGEENGAGTGWDVLLKSGSVYVQKSVLSL